MFEYVSKEKKNAALTCSCVVIYTHNKFETHEYTKH